MTENGGPSPKAQIISRASDPGISAIGGSLVIHEWSGPDYAHVHHFDDEAWHVLEGSLRFEFP